MFQHGAIPTTVTQRCSLTFQTHTLTHTFISISFPFALSTKTCLTRKHYSTESKCFWRQANGNVWKRLFLFSFFSPPLMCAVVDHVECTSIWWKVASASCCVPFLKKRHLFFFFWKGEFHLWTWPQLLPLCVATSTHIVLHYQSSHHASRSSLILQSTLKGPFKDCIFINLFKKKKKNWGSGWCLHSGTTHTILYT